MAEGWCAVTGEDELTAEAEFTIYRCKGGATALSPRGRILCSHTNTGYVAGGFGAVPAKQGRLGGGTSGLTHATLDS